MWKVCCYLILFYNLPPPCLSLSLLSSISIPSSLVCHVSRSSLKRPLKKIRMSWFSPCWSTATQRRWTRGSVSVLSSFFFTLSHLCLSIHSLLCSSFVYLCHTHGHMQKHMCTHRHVTAIHSELNMSYHNPRLHQSPLPRYVWFLFFSSSLVFLPLCFTFFQPTQSLSLAACLSAVFLSMAALMKG